MALQRMAKRNRDLRMQMFCTRAMAAGSIAEAKAHLDAVISDARQKIRDEKARVSKLLAALRRIVAEVPDCLEAPEESIDEAAVLIAELEKGEG